MVLDYSKLAGGLWWAIGILWLLGMTKGKRTLRSQPAASRSLQTAGSVVAFFLVFSHSFHSGWLVARFVPESSAAGLAGLLVTLAGLAFAAWSRLQLGGNWSAAATVKEDHTLICRGPYAIVRHPIYTGLVLGLLGTAIVLGEVRGLLGCGLLFVAFVLKSKSEEVFMLQTFDGQYVRYQQRVKSLIPFVY